MMGTLGVAPSAILVRLGTADRLDGLLYVDVEDARSHNGASVPGAKVRLVFDWDRPAWILVADNDAPPFASSLTKWPVDEPPATRGCEIDGVLRRFLIEGPPSPPIPLTTVGLAVVSSLTESPSDGPAVKYHDKLDDVLRRYLIEGPKYWDPWQFSDCGPTPPPPPIPLPKGEPWSPMDRNDPNSWRL
jgi:hypothetical protein